MCKNFNLQSSVHIFLRISLQMYFGILEWNTKYGCLLNDLNLNEDFDDQCGLYRNKVSSAVALTWEGRQGKLKFNFCFLFSFWTRVRAIYMWQNCAFRRLVLHSNLDRLNCNLKVLLIAWSFPRFLLFKFRNNWGIWDISQPTKITTRTNHDVCASIFPAFWATKTFCEFWLARQAVCACYVSSE